MTRKLIIGCLQSIIDIYEMSKNEKPWANVPIDSEDVEAIRLSIEKWGEQNAEPCEDAISRQAALKCFTWSNDKADAWNGIKNLPPVTPQKMGRWIPVSERLPEAFSYVTCTCHSLIDDREDWVIETAYIPQRPNSPYSDWGNIPMLNWHECEVIAWMYRDIPEPYTAESVE